MTINQSANELYTSLPPKLVDLLRQYECPATMKEGAHVITHGEDPDQLVIVCSGQVFLSLPSRGNAVVLGTAGPGKVLGLRSMISGELPEIDAVCACDCRVAMISKGKFMDALNKYPEIYFAIAKVLSSDLEFAEHYLKNTSHSHLRRLRKHSC